jgi:hypothetical protein
MPDRRFGYTIYKNPSDHPGMYVMRGWDVEDGKTVMSDEALCMPISEFALEILRTTLGNQGLFCIGRQSMDDPVIVETWI